MRNLSIRLLSVAAAASLLAATSAAQQTIRVADTGATLRTWTVDGAEKAAVTRDGGRTWIPLPESQRLLNWRSRSFDPAQGDPGLPANLGAGQGNQLHYVQFVTDVIPEYAQVVKRLGSDVAIYYPHEAYIVRMAPEELDVVREQPFVRAVMALSLGHKLDTPLQDGLLDGSLGTARYNIMMVNKRADAQVLAERIVALGGVLEHEPDGGILLQATLTPAQLRAVGHLNEVLWIDEWTAPEFDVDNARIQGGMDYVETQATIDGQGITGLLNEAVHEQHPEFAARPPYRTGVQQYGGNSTNFHGTNTAGEIYAMGLAGGVKGLLPYAQMVEANSVGGGRYAMATAMQNPTGDYKAVMWTQSWGGGRTFNYTSTSALLDDILFDFPRLYATNSQSNAGNRNSRPEAWAKNVVGVGGFNHFNNSFRGDDCWCNTGSTGPAQDDRVGVTFASFYDSIRTTDGPGGYTNSFGGTSGATPIVNGLSGGAIEMFTDGLLGYPGVPWTDRFNARPNLTTTRVMLACSSNQLSFITANPTNRFQQGWGMPNLQKLYDLRDETLILDEEDVLLQGEVRDYWVWVKPGTGALRASMHHLEDAAVPSAIPTRINSLDLSVTEYASGTVWWGNDMNPGGLRQAQWSVAGGAPNDIDIHENVFIQAPPAGVYKVQVAATMVRADSHVETPGMDADFALAIRGIGGGRDRSGMTLDMISNVPGQLDVTIGNLPAGGWTRGITMFSKTTDRHLSLGSTFGVERDSLSTSIIKFPAGEGKIFAFTPSANPALYPNATYSFDPAILAPVAGKTLDAVIVLFDASGAIVDVSNAARVTVM